MNIHLLFQNKMIQLTNHKLYSIKNSSSMRSTGIVPGDLETGGNTSLYGIKKAACNANKDMNMNKSPAKVKVN